MIFSNTTPFIALSAINRLELLPALFTRVHVVEAVVRECAAGDVIPVPPLDRIPWINVVSLDTKPNAEPMLLHLDEGEKWTLHAAKVAHAERLLIDERIGRTIAERMGLKVTGSLGILLKARTLGLIPSFTDAARAMRERGLFYHTGLIDRLARSIGE